MYPITFSPKFTCFSTLKRRPRPLPPPPLKLGTVTLHQVFSNKHLGITLTPNLSWNEYISNSVAKANKRLFIMKAFKYSPIVAYGDLLFDSCTKALSNMIEEIQLQTARTATRAKRQSPHAALYSHILHFIIVILVTLIQ